MKKIPIFIILVLYCFESIAQKRIFLNVSLNNRYRPVKGYLLRTGDSTLLIGNRKDSISLNYRNIKSVRTGKSAGSDILLGTIIGASTGVIGGLVSYNKPPPGPLSIDFGRGATAVFGMTAGAMVGVVVGAVHGLLKHRETFEVNGNYEKWLAFRARMSR